MVAAAGLRGADAGRMLRGIGALAATMFNAVNRRCECRGVGQRLESGGNACGRLRIGGGKRLAGANGGDLGGSGLFRRCRGVAPEAAGIDDVSRRLRLRFGLFGRRRKCRFRSCGLCDLCVGRGELEGRGDCGFERGIGTGSADLAGGAAAVRPTPAVFPLATEVLEPSSSSSFDLLLNKAANRLGLVVVEASSPLPRFSMSARASSYPFSGLPSEGTCTVRPSGNTRAS